MEECRVSRVVRRLPAFQVALRGCRVSLEECLAFQAGRRLPAFRVCLLAFQAFHRGHHQERLALREE